VDLSVSANEAASQTIVEVRGDVDVHSAPQLRNRLTDVIDSGSKLVIVDLSKLDFIDSTGLGALVAVRNHGSDTESTLRLVCASERLLKLFRITGLHEVFDIYANIPSAVETGTAS
jgi:anti-sigma B factor antagonist